MYSRKANLRPRRITLERHHIIIIFLSLLLISLAYILTTGITIKYKTFQNFIAVSRTSFPDNKTTSVTTLKLTTHISTESLYHTSVEANTVVQVVLTTDRTPTSDRSFHHTTDTLNIPVTNINSLDDDLLSNLSSKTAEFKENPGYFENFTYFYLNSSRVSDIPSQYSIPGTSVCSGDVDLLVMIMSVKQHSDWRLLIRQTWASPIYDKSWSQKGLVRLVFFFGNEGFADVENLALYNESKLYGDIVVASFKDNYGNLSLKLATALTWASKHCPQAKFVAKVDMDTFVHLKVFLKLVQHVAQNYTDFIIGYQHIFPKPYVVRDGKWAVPHHMYAFSFFPKYVYGHSYVLTSSVVHKMAASFPFVHIVPNEDAFITGIMAVTLNITRLGNTAFAFSLKQYTFCDLVYKRYVSAMYNVKYMKELWDAMLTGNCTETQIT
ncbi:beta-1,3-galactosyltransferase 1-like isoform X2 [Physella acuta]|nr:beta-1,3-galactosyltransferase 1-like isoform X2 [Physella acuta]